MTWFRVDDKLHSHVKPVRAGLQAVGAWVLAGSWCGDHLTDGAIPREVAHRLASPAVWGKLVAAGMAEVTPDGYQLHDFLDWNPSAAEVRAERERKAEAGRRGGQASGIARLTRSKTEAGASRLLPEPPNSRPVPSRPDPRSDPPVGPPGGAPNLPGIDPKPPRARGDRKVPAGKRPADWKPNEGHYQRGGELGIERKRVGAEADRFRDFHDAKGSTFSSWDAAFRTWLGNVQRFAGRNEPPPTAPTRYTREELRENTVQSAEARRPPPADVQVHGPTERLPGLDEEPQEPADVVGLFARRRR